MCRGIAPFGAAALAAAISLAMGGPASAQMTWPPPPEVNAFELPARELAPRPRMSMAIGMGSTFDAVGFPNGTNVIPAFYATAGVGDGLLGVDFEAFASSASGRCYAPNASTHCTTTYANPVDRLALDAFGVFRPAARVRPQDRRYRMRVLRAVGAEVGLGLERDGRATASGTRFTVHAGVRVELPLTPIAPGSELRLRLAASRSIGLFTPNIYGTNAGDVTAVGDTIAEVYAALVVLF